MRAVLASFLLAATASSHAADSVRLELSADDRMVFSKTTFEVTSGQKVALVFKNNGKKGEKSMKHNVVLLKPGNTIVAFAVKCNAAAATGYVPADPASKEQMVGHVPLIGGGQSATLTFTAGEPGDYPFFCSSPGHFDKMQGKITVKPK
jgi:azurin